MQEELTPARVTAADRWCVSLMALGILKELLAGATDVHMLESTESTPM